MAEIYLLRSNRKCVHWWEAGKAWEKFIRCRFSGDMVSMLQGLYLDSESTVYLQMLWSFRARSSMSDRQSMSKPKGQAGSESPLLGRECCATAVLSAREDSGRTRSRLQEIGEDEVHIFILCLEFHCELNWIEYYRGRYKYFTHKNCSYSLSGKQPEFSTCTWF